MTEQRKRSYTVPVLLIVVTVLSTLCIMFYSKSLLHDQREKTQSGQRLAEGYNYAIMFADRLHTGAQGLTSAKSEAERLNAKEQLGAASVAGGEAADFLIDAFPYYKKSEPTDEEKKSIHNTMNAVLGKIQNAAEHDGPLTADEREYLTSLSAQAGNMSEALAKFRPPSGEAGYRQMQTGGEWVPLAQTFDAMLDALGKKQ
jgi:hypothetical protein